jgi:hypothetical protein
MIRSLSDVPEQFHQEKRYKSDKTKISALYKVLVFILFLTCLISLKMSSPTPQSSAREQWNSGTMK